MDKKINKPSKEMERLLDSVMEDNITLVTIPRTQKTYKLSWLKNGAKRKLTTMALKEKNGWKLSTKSAAIVILNNFWKLIFIYPFLWRWFSYVNEYDDGQLMPVLLEAKKKVPLESYWTNTILVTDMRDTVMTMMKTEAVLSQPEPSTEKPLP